MAAPTRQASRLYAREFSLAMVAYAVVVVVASGVLVDANRHAAWRWAVVVLPMVPSPSWSGPWSATCATWTSCNAASSSRRSPSRSRPARS